MKKVSILFITLICLSNIAYSETFSSQKMARPLDMVRVFTGGTSPVFIQFSGKRMTGCSGDSVGYLKPGWLSNTFDHKGADRMLPVLS